jgi:hypothetical protein
VHTSLGVVVTRRPLFTDLPRALILGNPYSAGFVQLNSPQQLRYRTGFLGRRGHGEGLIKQRWYRVMIRLREWTAWSCRSSAAGRSI